jgi:hypothetical protein
MIVPIRVSGLIFVIFPSVLLSMATEVRGEIWTCPQVDGKELYSDRQLNSRCRKLENLPPLRRAPATPLAPETQGKPQGNIPATSEPIQVPMPGRGRQIDPPSNAAITIHLDNSTLRVQNLDSDWTAHKLCFDVFYHVAAESSRDVHLKKCLSGLKPMEVRKLSVFGLPSEVTVESVDWVR